MSTRSVTDFSELDGLVIAAFAEGAYTPSVSGLDPGRGLGVVINPPL